MPAASRSLMMVWSARSELGMITDVAFFRFGAMPCGSVPVSVCGETGMRTVLMPMALNSLMSCTYVRPLGAQKTLPMYCSIGAPLGLVGSVERSEEHTSELQSRQYLV